MNANSFRASRFLLIIPILALPCWCSDSDAQTKSSGLKEGKVLPQYLWDEDYEGSGQGYYVIGMNYYLGNNVKRDIFKAVENLDISAERGNPDAQYTLGFIYLNGGWMNQSNDKALDYWTLAAKNNHLKSQMLLAEVFAAGELGKA